MTDSYDAVVGVWDGHDAGAALVIDGKVVIALNEERLSGRKLEVGFPFRAIEIVREAAGKRRIAWAGTTSDPAKTLTRMFPSTKESYYRIRRRLVPPNAFHRLTLQTKYSLTQLPTNSFLQRWARSEIASELGVRSKDVFVVNHHAAHAAFALFWPNWQSDVLAVTLDGIGDGESGSVWKWKATECKMLRLLSISGQSSLGLFFEHITNELQMRPLEDEGKVMALASYSADIPLDKNIFLKWYSLTRDDNGFPSLVCRVPASKMAKEVSKVVWCTPREQICRMAQQTLEELVPKYVQGLIAATGCTQIAYAGGVASNIRVNRLIRLTPGITRFEVCPAMGDGGLAVGAALFTWNAISGRRPQPFLDFKLGSDQGDLGREAERFAHEAGASVTYPEDIAATVATYVAAGKIVMWAQGRMELGARALGARSIVARADNTKARDELNLRLKRRVWYQPFCPSVLLSEAGVLFADYRGPADANFHMTSAFMTTSQGRIALAGAIGIDGSCRPQMVAENDADLWYRFLVKVKQLTGTGAVINTSLNIHGKPVSDRPQGIVEAWKESGVEYLALGTAFLKKPF